MAKYRLEKNHKKSVNCEILHENLNGYIVRFDNGMIKNVKKSNVYALDRIDEAVLDDVRAGISKFGRRVADVGKRVIEKVKGWISNVLNINGVVAFTDGNNVIKSVHPINTMNAAKMYDGVGFYPSNSLIEMCGEIGVEPEVVEDSFDDEYEGSIIYNLMQSKSKNENASATYSVARKIYEDINNEIIDKYPTTPEGKIRMYMEIGDDLIDSDQGYIVDQLLNQWHSLYTRKRSEGAMPINIILGAPGVGKSAIIEGLKSTVKDAYSDVKDPFGNSDDINIITINASSVSSEAFTLPAVTGQSQKFYRYRPDSELKRELSIERSKTSEVIKDLPKTWLPVYDRADATKDLCSDVDGGITMEVYHNAIANGGYTYEDEKGHVKLYDGPGGVFFIDEYFRMQSFAKDSLMTIATSRTIGNNLKFGDRWLIVAASNRFQDMSTTALMDAFMPEGADELRLHLYNFVPRVNDWLVWAQKTNKKTNRPNVMSDIVQFVNEKTNGGSSYDYFYDNLITGDRIHDTEKPRVCPRSWEMFSEDFAEFTSVEDGILTFTDMLSNDNISFSPGRKNTQQDKLMYIKRACAGILGSSVAREFGEWLKEKMSTLTLQIATELYNAGPYATNVSIETNSYIHDAMFRMTPDTFIDVFQGEMTTYLNNTSSLNIDFDRLKNIVDCLCYVVDSYKKSKQTGNVDYSIYNELRSIFETKWPGKKRMDLETYDKIKAYTNVLSSGGSRQEAQKAANLA